MIGDLIGGRYEIIDIIDDGGMGTVYCCYDEKDDTVYALKTFKSNLSLEPIIKMFKRESYTWVNINPHQNIVKVFVFDVLDDKPFIILEYVPIRNEHVKGLY
jgi:serine/threonine protein kinase